MDIKLAKTKIRKQVGGSYSLLTSILSMGRALAPTVGKALSLSALAGLASEGASQLVKTISGGNLLRDVVGAERTLASTLKKITGGQVGDFLIPQNKINQLIAYKHLLFAKQKHDILNVLQTGSGVRIKQIILQLGNGLGTILASMGIPLAIELVKKITFKSFFFLVLGGHQDWGQVLENKMVMEPLDWACISHSSFYRNMGTNAWRW